MDPSDWRPAGDYRLREGKVGGQQKMKIYSRDMEPAVPLGQSILIAFVIL
jgi:hypothetical protein